jgi:hypothetical protein
MDRKIIGIGIGAVLVISLVAIMGFAFAQQPKSVVAGTGFVDADKDGVCDNAQSGNCPYAKQAGGFVDADKDGVCDNAANCPKHDADGGCHGSGGCPGHTGGVTGGCHKNAKKTE